MSTKVTNDMTKVKQQNSDGPGRIDTKIIKQYNNYMGGVDLADQ